MKQTSRWTLVGFAGAVFVMICILIVATGSFTSGAAAANETSSGFTYGAVAANGTFTPTAWVYLPYITNPGAYVLSNHSHYISSIGSLWIVGEVANPTANHLRIVKITADVFNSSGALIATGYDHIALDSLPPGDKTCFRILVGDEPADWSYYEFEDSTYWTDGEPLPNLTILHDSGSYNPTYGWYELMGQVRNDHGTQVQFVSAIGTLYNASGTVVGCSDTLVNSTHLDSGQASSFKMIFMHRDYADVAWYRLQVSGTPQ